MGSNVLGVKKLNPLARLPEYATEGSACFDIYGIESSYDEKINALIFSTGLVFDIPKGKAMMIYSRSGHGFKQDARLSNCVGVIDSDYTGEVKVKIVSDRPTGEYPAIDPTTAIAQGMIVDAPQWQIAEVETIKDTARGANGFGSTDKKAK